jgi:hypothetical protein
MNDGDWVESCTALVEHHDGRWEIVTWTQESDNGMDIDSDSSTHKQSKRSTGTSGNTNAQSTDLQTSVGINQV